MSRRAPALISTALVTAGLFAALSPAAHAAPPPRTLTSQGAWVKTGTVTIDGATTGHGLAPASSAVPLQQYGPDGWETLYLDKAGHLQDVVVSQTGTTVTAVPTGFEPWWGDFPGGFDVDPVTGNAVVCGWRGDDGDGRRLPRFVTRVGADGTWSAPRDATLAAGQFAVNTSCAVNGSQVMIAVGTQTNQPVVDYDNERDTGGAAAVAPVESPDSVPLTMLDPTLHADTYSSAQGSGVESATAVTAAAAGTGFAVALALTAVTTVSGSTKDWTTATSVTRVPAGTSVADATAEPIQSATFGDRPNGYDGGTQPPGGADGGGGAILVTTPSGGGRVTDGGITTMFDSRYPAGYASYTGTTVVPSTGPGPVWVLTGNQNGVTPTLYQVTSSNLSDAIKLPGDTNTGIAGASFAWWAAAPFRPSITAPDGSLWLAAPCNDDEAYDQSVACLIRYTAGGTRIGRVEATPNYILPTSATTAEGLDFRSSDNPTLVHFDSEAPQNSGDIAVGGTPRSDGSYVWTPDTPTTLSTTTTDATTGEGAAVAHRWTVDGIALKDQDFDTTSTTSVSYRFSPGQHKVTYQAQDEAGNATAEVSKTITVVQAGAPLTDFGPVTGLQVTQSDSATGVSVAASWDPVASATGYNVVLRDAAGTDTARSVTASSANFTVPFGPAADLTVTVTPTKAEGVGMPASTSFSLQQDTVAPTGEFTLSPKTAWTKLTTVTLTQTKLSDNRDAAGSVTRKVDWGDGVRQAWAQPGTSLTHTYAKAGRWTPTVTLTDAATNAATVSAKDSVTVIADTARPTVTVTRPAKASLQSVAAWRTLRGTATDTGTGLKSLTVSIIEKRGTRFYGYDFGKRTWSRGVTTAAAAKSLARATAPGVAATGAWAAATIAGLTKGTLTVYATAGDRAGNTALTTVSQTLTR